MKALPLLALFAAVALLGLRDLLYSFERDGLA